MERNEGREKGKERGRKGLRSREGGKERNEHRTDNSSRPRAKHRQWSRILLDDWGQYEKSLARNLLQRKSNEVF